MERSGAGVVSLELPGKRGSSLDTPETVELLGLEVSSVSLAQTVEIIEEWIRSGRSTFITCTGMHGVMESRSDPELLDAHRRAGMIVPDGMPLVWVNRYFGHRHVDRVYGPDLLLAVCERSVEPDAGFRHFFYGAAEGVAEELAQRLRARYPGLAVAGTYSPPFRPVTPEEDREIVQMIRAARPDIVWVGLSTPKQERWMAEHVDRLDGPVLIGVGAAFDFHTGRLTQAPRWIRRAGMEWLFRLLTEPRRLWKRYWKNVPLFLALILREMAVTGRRRNRARSSGGS